MKSIFKTDNPKTAFQLVLTTHRTIIDKFYIKGIEQFKERGTA